MRSMPDVSLVGELRCPRVQPDANAHVQPARPRVVAQPALRLERRGDRAGCLGEDGTDLVAGGVDLTPLLLVHGGAHDAAHGSEDVSVDRPGLLDESCRALDVREQERDRAGGEGAHAVESRARTPRARLQDAARGGSASTLSDPRRRRRRCPGRQR